MGGCLGEAADEEVAHGDVGAGGAGEHLAEACEEVGGGAGVEDVHGGYLLME